MSYVQGEVCVAGSCVIVQEGIYDELAKKLTEKAKSWVVGDPFDPKSQYGPQDDMLIAKDEIFGPIHICVE
ncbi:hypothetical protein Droror1_Dr00012427 [Drosera rotundifolia]